MKDRAGGAARAGAVAAEEEIAAVAAVEIVEAAGEIDVAIVEAGAADQHGADAMGGIDRQIGGGRDRRAVAGDERAGRDIYPEGPSRELDSADSRRAVV